MAQSSSRSDDALKKPTTSKRKRRSDDEDSENVMPVKKMYTYLDSQEDNPPSSSSSSSSDEAVGFSSVPQPESNDGTVGDSLYSDDNSYSPQFNVLSPLENVIVNDSTSHLKRKHSKTNLSCCPRKRKCPFPSLSWADHCDVWQKMCEGDVISAASRSERLFQYHPGLQLRMRAILLDWLNEVCEVYKMYRETFHLTVNYIDRYLSCTEDVYKGRLQLIGITSLFIAAKVEEIYPPKILEFAYVTDGACSQEEILEEEMVILTALEWRTTPTTINRWISAYMQLNCVQQRRNSFDVDKKSEEMKKYTFIFPQYSSLEYAICGQLIDLALLHVDVNAYAYGLIAAAAIAHIFDKDVAMRVSSFTWEELSACYSWLAPFAEVLGIEGGAGAAQEAATLRTLPDSDLECARLGGGLPRICPNINLDQSHRIQVHNICLDHFDKVLEAMAARAALVPPISPPPSSHKKTSELAAQTLLIQP